MKKTIKVVLFLLFVGAVVAAAQKATVTDSRDGRTYKTVKIGRQIWMAENLNYEASNSRCYKSDPSCSKYGRLYTWTEAMGYENGCSYSEQDRCDDVQGVCPDGWHLPQYGEWKELDDYVEKKWGGSWNAPSALLVKSSEAPEGTNASGFSAYLHDPGFCANCFPSMVFWTATVSVTREYARAWELSAHRFSAYNLGGFGSKVDEYNVVRCVKDDVGAPKQSDYGSTGGPTSTITDTRDGTEYKTVKIGSQTWMAENLNIATKDSWCYGNKPSNCDEYGRLYFYETAKSVCPVGWHLPDTTEWRYLLRKGGASALALQANGAYFWGDTRNRDAFYLGVNAYEADFHKREGYEAGYYVRCVMDDGNARLQSSYGSLIKEPMSMITDTRDGKKYKTVKIGSQTWMAENLNYDAEDSYCRGGDCDEYGRSYTWMSALMACPDDWHLPSEAEWTTLLTEVGGQSMAGRMLKFVNGWFDGRNGQDAYGFSALPAGRRGAYKEGGRDKGDFIDHGTNAYFWTSTESDSKYAYGVRLFHSSDGARLNSDNNKKDGFSVRCIEGASKIKARAVAVADSLTKIRNKYIYENGGTFVDKRDGQEYRSIQIGDRIWMAENLKFENLNSSAHDSHLGLNNACLKDGGGCYYQWMLAQGRGLPGVAVEACPSGWRLPDTSDVKALFRTVGGSKRAAKSLKQNGSWTKNGPDLYGFSAERMPYPGVDYGPYAIWKGAVPFWTSTEVEKRFSYVANDLVWTMVFEDDGDAASVKTSPKGAYLPIRCVAKSEKKSGVVWNDGELSHENRLSSAKQEDDEIQRHLDQKKVKHGPHIAFLGGYPLMDGQPGYRGMQKVNNLIEGEVGYKVGFKVPYVWLALGLNLGVTYMNYTSSDEKQYFSYYYLGIPVSVRYPFAELLYVSGGVAYKRMLNFAGYPSYSRYIAMDGNTFLFSAGVGIMKGRWDFGLILGTEYLGDEKSNRGENFRNRYLNVGISADIWF